ncbi:2-amino-4-hydroxy-6-hydroxymethyldihydropteridine diphosphokinase [Helicobacter zhangjianzhongii]|uniref:2-amino-4-hydroxy-6-hydroxymethyldihydropteridine diphosphokinase n=1 Tax=Helicobacter zhangjianzhongii TaxID=2974574 RepID=A0ACC6FU32_9HELI|nr:MULTISPECIES: 2-amino-4-hydroxy-6-hydroxymethyldihydropteridine diphosphokinase [unclassified Helicobacter]MDL0080589.1 2-amino-4-hydroxy-6-hydroxymethyldihydropteridine diphosphokinase [Helicobacter sp. CPD2-1]MDL0082770.1 2-amino-4-hydroxy-6-hydroxymethyldihydropteridine diphosphokinase [Helicobacter sp. XJK30-2]
MDSRILTMDSKETSAIAERYPLFSKEATLCHALQGKARNDDTNADSSVGWILAPSFPTHTPRTSPRYLKHSATLRYQASHTIAASKAPCTAHSPTPRKSHAHAAHKLTKHALYNTTPAIHLPPTKSPRISPHKHRKIPATHRHIITLGIGANLGTKQAICKRFAHLLDSLTRNRHCSLLATSPILRNPPFGYANQPHFYNAIITLATSLSIVELFGLVFYLERRYGRGRKRAFKNAPRTLDIDIIFYDKVIIKRAYLTIPHKQFHTRDSVLLPLGFVLWQC